MRVWRQTIGRVLASSLDWDHGEVTVVRNNDTGPWMLVFKEVSSEDLGILSEISILPGRARLARARP